MLHPVAGDIILTRAEVLAHCVASADPMDSGLALVLRQRYPQLQQDFERWCRRRHPQPGTAWLWPGTPSAPTIATLVTHEYRAESGATAVKASERNVAEALRALAREIVDHDYRSLALPRLATGAGGLRWLAVWSVIEQCLGNLSLPIYVYVDFQSGKQAKEDPL